MTKWVIKENRIFLESNGSGFFPSASEIIGAEFKGRTSVKDAKIDTRPSDDLLELTFLRFPPEVRIFVYPPSSDLTLKPSCSLQLISNNMILVEDLDVGSVDIDQIIIENKWIPLVGELTHEAIEILRAAGISGPGLISLRQYANLRKQGNELVVYSATTNNSNITPYGDGDISHQYASLVQAKLYPYQQKGVEWLDRLCSEDMGCILADEMGLGKTLQIITILAKEALVRSNPSLVVTTATLVANWKREINKFAPQLKILVHRGSARTGFPKILSENNVVITTYDTVLRDLSLFSMLDWNVVALDEAQAIKTPIAQRTVALKELPRRVGIPVTGTPVENRLTDLWSLMDFAIPGYLGTLQQFEDRYESSPDSAELLEPIVTPFILRRRVSEVASDLPQRIDIPQPIELLESSVREYEQIRKEVADKYGKSAALPAIISLRMYCTHPFILSQNGGDPAIFSAKYARLVEIIEEIISRDEKVLIFTSFTKMSDLLLADVSNRFKMPGFSIDGRTQPEIRQEIVDAFQEYAGSAFLVLNPKAAGTGLNITAANHVIHYNLEWNPALEDQATARAFRRGQTKPVTVHRMFYIGTVEEIMNQRIEYKRDMADRAVIGVEGLDDKADIIEAINLSPVSEGV